MTTRRITCTMKDYRDSSPGHIISVGGPGWGQLRRLTVADQIQSGTHSYYTEDGFGRRAKVYVRGSGTSRYLTTSADGSKANNLISLPSCI